MSTGSSFIINALKKLFDPLTTKFRISLKLQLSQIRSTIFRWQDLRVVAVSRCLCLTWAVRWVMSSGHRTPARCSQQSPSTARFTSLTSTSTSTRRYASSQSCRANATSSLGSPLTTNCPSSSSATTSKWDWCTRAVGSASSMLVQHN